MKNIVFIVNIGGELERSKPYKYSVKSWAKWCEKNNCELVTLTERIYDKSVMNLNWHKIFVYDLLENEGLCLGGSSGINIAGAMHLAKELGPNHTIVTILCDYGTRYQSKLFNPSFLKSKGLPVPKWLLDNPVSMPSVFEE